LLNNLYASVFRAKKATVFIVFHPFIGGVTIFQWTFSTLRSSYVSAVSEDAGIEPETVAEFAFTVRAAILLSYITSRPRLDYT
jgi:hypothetical protein